MLIGAEHHTNRTSRSCDFFWRNAAGDVCAVFHGFGGGGSGQVIASWVRDAMTDPIADSLPARARWPIERAHEIALARVEPVGVAGGSMACVAIRDDRIAIAHLGDARVYRLSASGLECLTRDHTMAESRDPEFAKLRAQLAPSDAARILLRSIGARDRFEIEVSEYAWSPGEVIALCTSGVFHTLGDELAAWLARGQAAPSAIASEVAKRAPELPAAVAMLFRPPFTRIAAPPPAPQAPAPSPIAPSPLDEDPPARPFLEVRHARDPRLVRRRYPLASPVVTIGRSADSDIAIDCDSVSRRHARVEERAEGFWVVDVSTNGTYVEGKPVQGARLLRRGEELHIGATIFAFGYTTIDIEIVENFDAGTTIDGLTGLHNRRHFLELIARALEHARRDRRPLAIARFDIARFKRLNDAHGFKTGDEILRAIAGLAKERARPGDAIARLPGDEFAWLLPDTDRDLAQALAETLRATVKARTFAIGDAVIEGVDLWVGVAQATEEPQTAPELLGEADPILPRIGLKARG